ncbi:rhodanese-like domain-containing protein [Chloroflexota bacterium]
MKRQYTVMIAALLLLVAGLVATGSCAEKAMEAPGQPIIKDISAQEALDLIQENQENPDFIIVDVRTPQEFADGHIENAINIDFNSGAFQNEIGKLDRNKKYLIYCRSGNRSRGALDVMIELDFREVYHLYTGIISWEEAGFMIVK